MTEHDVETSLGRVRVHETGPAEPLATIAMWPSLLLDASLFRHQVDHFARTHRVLAVDPPGQGGSGPLQRDFTITECADVAVEVLDALGVERAHLIGSSWGAMVFGAVAALHPDRVERCVLVNGTASDAPRSQRWRYGLLLTTARVLGGIRWPLTRSVVQAFLGPTSLRERPEVAAWVARTTRANRVGSASRSVRSVVPRRPDHRELFGRIRVPVLIIAGFEDRTFPMPEVQAMASCIPGAQLTVLSDAAHLVVVECPDVVNELVEDFLSR